MMAKQALEQPVLLRAGEAARLLGISRSMVFKLVATKQLPAVHIGTAVRIPAAALPAWIQARTRSE